MIKLDGVEEKVRVLCDQGAQVNVISQRVVQDWKLPSKASTVRLVAYDGGRTHKNLREVTLSMEIDGGRQQLRISCVIVPGWGICLPERERTDIRTPVGVEGELADPSFRSPAPVMMILGAGVMAWVTKDKSIMSDGFRWQDSGLGWLVFGGAGMLETKEVMVNVVQEEQNLERLLSRFWEMDEMPDKRIRSQEEEKCEAIFVKGYSTDHDGRYRVRIPLRDSIEDLGSSREAALRRFSALERRFHRDSAFKKKYFEQMDALLEAGHLKKCTRSPGKLVYYLPHHAVTKKFRIVYDASCKTDRGRSLNDCQFIGERLQDDLFTLLIRFRTHMIAITADIKKMYLQVAVADEHLDLQRVFWREGNEEIAEYWLTRVTFGMASAPHCAVRAMIQCAEDHGDRYPKAAAAVKHDFYMDDCLTGCESKEEAKELVRQLQLLLGAGCFELGKWHSNSKDIRTLAGEEKQFHEDPSSSVLGLSWNGTADELGYQWRGREAELVPTKRGIVADLAQIFDPLGLVGPAIVPGKIMVQHLTKAKVGWDETLKPAVIKEWNDWRDGLKRLQQVKIPRWTPTRQVIAIHGFADASEVAYGAVVYLQSNSTDGMIMLASKSRIAPTKGLTIPRMELCAALVLARLIEAVSGSLGLAGAPICAWSDSMIVLHWLKRDAGLKVFVHNRVQNILRLSATWKWAHVRSEQNPADLLSRGVQPEELHKDALWWKGPKLGDLMKAHEVPPLTATEEQALEVERKQSWDEDGLSGAARREHYRALVNVLRTEEISPMQQLLERTSGLEKLILRTCWIQRFIRNCKRGRVHQKVLEGAERTALVKGTHFSNDEREAAMKLWVKEEQSAWYQDEKKALEKGLPLPTQSSLTGLTPFLDGDGLLRVLGRLNHTELPFDQKHPWLLPDSSRFARLMVEKAHKATLHGGFKVLAVQIRERVWITRLRQLCKKVIGRCLPCVRHRPQAVKQLMGSLPAARVTAARAFQRSSVDYAGPFELKTDLPRSRVRLKKYVAVFVCMVSKGVHLELVENLTTKAFISAFTRFNALKGPCHELWSDNGTAFVGADKELGRMLESWQRPGSDENEAIVGMPVEWNFITPRAPHQGGLWEAAVKSMKFHLTRTIGGQTLNSAEWSTLLAQIAAILNARPLAPMSEDPEDLGYLTAGHLIGGASMVQLFGHRRTEEVGTIRDRYELVQALSQQFWKRWKDEYLLELQGRTKWREGHSNLKIGDMVIVMEDEIAPSCWKIGRIQQVYPGADGWVRNVKIRTAGKKRPSKRAVQKLVLLPVRED